MLASAQLDHPWNPPNVRPKSRALVSAAGLRGSRSRLPHQFSNVRAFRNSLVSIAAMLKRVLVASRAPEPNAPPCMRQRLLPWTEGDLQGLPERVLAPQRGLESIGPVLRL
jgi:hypothetical protein